jgi:arylsulfatase A-like enzyme
MIHRSRNHHFSVFCLLLAPIFITNSCIEKKEIPPNILIVNVDDLGWKDLGVYGSTFYETPNIDQLATEGMMFTSAYAAAANCAPSRASMFTGRYSPYHGIYTVSSSERGKTETRRLIPTPNTTILNDSISTLVSDLKNVGYKTISLGKWHISESPLKQDFDINVGGGPNGHPKSYFSPYLNENLSDGPEGEYLTDRLTEEAIQFLKENGNDPFFLYLPYYTVHTPLQGKEELIEKYNNKVASGGQSHAVYAAMIESLDKNFGRIMQTLKELGLRENTMVIFTSDNGGIRGISTQEPLRAGKGSYYEGGIRVPMIIRWPGNVAKGKQSDEPVINIDLYPTILEILNDSNPNLDGQSLIPILTEKEAHELRSLFWHFPIYLQAYDRQKDDGRDSLFRTRPGSVIRLGKWKLHEYFEDGGLELYDLEKDIGERSNLIGEYPDIANQLLDSLNDWRANNQAPVPRELNPYFVDIE